MLLAVSTSSAFYQGSHVAIIHDFTEVYSSASFYAIKFYAGWCGHCQEFAPRWRATAANTCAASPALRLGAVDCVADYLMCQNLEIASFPTIRVFGPGIRRSGAPVARCEHGCDAPLAAILRTLPDQVVVTVVQSALGASGASVSTRAAAAAALVSASARCNTTVAGGGAGGKAVVAAVAAPSSGPVLQDVASAVVYGLQACAPSPPLLPSA
jgi:hypothetical protein